MKKEREKGKEAFDQVDSYMCRMIASLQTAQVKLAGMLLLVLGDSREAST